MIIGWGSMVKKEKGRLHITLHLAKRGWVVVLLYEKCKKSEKSCTYVISHVCIFVGENLQVNLKTIQLKERLLLLIYMNDWLTYCCVASNFLVCDSSAAFSISDVNPPHYFLSCASYVIWARSLLECRLIGCWISARTLLNNTGKIVLVVLAVCYH